MNFEIIKSSMEKLIANPRHCGNDRALVCNHMNDAGFIRESNAYWSWVCRTEKTIPGLTDEQMDVLKELLKTIWENDGHFEMPSWGTYGT